MPSASNPDVVDKLDRNGGASRAGEVRSVRGPPKAGAMGLGLSALGIVFGDIGTSPLYTVRTVLDLAGGKPDEAMILGILSLVFWTLVVVATIKYVGFAMSLDNDGEGGILALMSLVGHGVRRPAILAIGLLGAALIYGDGAVTPAISVLSALEGLNVVAPASQAYVLPSTIAVLLILFAIQPFGTELIGKAFGPIMGLWFAALAALGLNGLWHHPSVLAAADPLHAVRFLASGGGTAFLVLGGVFLCVTGAEALYADMGHFGAKPIRVCWLAIVFPSLVLNYAGQAAVVLDGGHADGSIFYQLCPGWFLVPMVVLATLATVIASQAIIAGAFSMTRQAIQLGWLPRFAVKQTSSEGYGRVYVGSVNWLLMLVTVGLALAFRKSGSLASAYGIAVSLTMLMTTALLFIALREVWGWRSWSAGPVVAAFLIVDAAFVCANVTKVADGGYAPLLLAAAIYGTMWIWHRGSAAVEARLAEDLMPFEDFSARMVEREIPRVPGTAVFLTRTDRDVPPGLLWHLQHNRALHSDVIVMTITSAQVPWTDAAERLRVEQLEPHFWRAVATYGFMEHPDVSALVDRMTERGCTADPSDVTFYVGHATIMHRDDGSGMPRWQEAIYAALERNSTHVGTVLRLPREQTVELGREVAI